MKFISSLATLEQINGMDRAMTKAGLRIARDNQAGCMKAYGRNQEGREVEIFAALEKGAGQPWIVRHVENLFS
jgi:hypothetical protein